MKKTLLLAAILIFTFCVGINAQIVEITANPGTSATPALGTSSYTASEAIYTEAEIGAGNFITPSTAIQSIGFSVSTLGANTSFGMISIYMKDVPLTTTTFTSGTFSTAGYTLVYTGSATFSTTGFTDITLTTPYVRTAGNNLQVLIKREDGVSHSGFVWNCAIGNNLNGTTSNYTTRRYNSTTAISPTTNLTISGFRQAIRLKHEYPNDISVDAVYVLGKVPMPNGSTQPISVAISNPGTTAQTNLNITLDITGANAYNYSLVVPSLAAGADTVLNFPPITFANLGINVVNVSVPTDDNNTNNSKTVNQNVNTNTWSYAYSSTPSGGVGFNGGTGDFVARFNTNLPTFISQITINFNTGGQPFKIGIWDATGTNGTPGTLIWESSQQTSVSGAYILPVVPFVSLSSGDFFVGVRQTGTTNVSFSYQTETPIRAATFYYCAPSGSTTWNDFAPANPFRFMIEPKLTLTNDAAVSALTVNGGSATSCSGSSQNVSVVVSNTGASPINANDVSVYLKISGANTYTTSSTNNNIIPSGGSETVVFSNVPVPNSGTDYDTAWVTLVGDTEHDNDTFKQSHKVLSVINTIPLTEGFESSTFKIGNLTQLSGNGNWSVGNTASSGITPHSGALYAKFNSFSFATGTSSRLFSECITIPSAVGSGCGALQLGFFMGHDAGYSTSLDSVYVSISTDGGASWTRVAGYQRYDATFTTAGWKHESVDLAPYAGQTIEIAFEAISKFGNDVLLDDVFIGPAALQNVTLANSTTNGLSLQAVCDDQGWTYYAPASNLSAHLLAINWDPSSTGANTAAKAAATASIQVDGYAHTVQTTSPAAATFSMRRYWNVNLNSTTMTAPVNLRFFYDSSDIADVTTAVNSFVSTYGGTAETPTWFKTTTGDFANDGLHMNEQGVYNAIALTNVNTTNERINGFPYAQFDGITSFSGGTYAAGVGTNNPLPTTLIDIVAQSVGMRNLIMWFMSASTTTAQFELEKSNDGRNYKLMEKQQAVALDGKEHSYTAYDYAPQLGENYYRLKMIDVAGGISYSKVVIVSNNNNASVSIYPNPVTDNINIHLSTVEAGETVIRFTDMAGKVVKQTSTHYSKGTAFIIIPVSELAKGSYFVKMNIGDQTFTQRFSIH